MRHVPMAHDSKPASSHLKSSMRDNELVSPNCQGGATV